MEGPKLVLDLSLKGFCAIWGVKSDIFKFFLGLFYKAIWAIFFKGAKALAFIKWEDRQCLILLKE